MRLLLREDRERKGSEYLDGHSALLDFVRHNQGSIVQGTLTNQTFEMFYKGVKELWNKDDVRAFVYTSAYLHHARWYGQFLETVDREKLLNNQCLTCQLYRNPSKTSAEKFAQHQNTPHTLPCKHDSCPVRFTHEKHRKRHYNQQHGENHQCPKCLRRKDGRTESRWKDHLDSHHGYNCITCGLKNIFRSFRRKEHLEEHFEWHRNSDPTFTPPMPVEELLKIINADISVTSVSSVTKSHRSINPVPYFKTSSPCQFLVCKNSLE